MGELTVHVDDDQTFRYRDASGDLMPIHVDDEVAKAVGLPGIIVHASGERRLYAFETVSSRGDTVITNGRAEIAR